MSLVIAEIHDGGVTLVADTKVTHEHDEPRTRHVLEHALPKLVILRDNLCVGLAGNDPAGVIASLVGHRHLPIAAIKDLAVGIPHASFVIAALGKRPAIWQVRRGRVEDRTAVGRAWIGDSDGYEIFQEQYRAWPAGTDPAFRLLSSLQWLLTWNVVPSIGGYHTRVGTTRNGFRFAADVSSVGPEEVQGLVSVTSTGVSLRLSTPPGGDQTTFALECAVGDGQTFGALAYLVTPLGLGILFPHESPAEPIGVRCHSIAELVDRAAREHGQLLVGISPPLRLVCPPTSTDVLWIVVLLRGEKRSTSATPRHRNRILLTTGRLARTASADPQRSP